MTGRRRAIAVLAAWILAAPLNAETVRSTSRLNLREGPALSSRRMLVMSAGRELLVLERRGEWLRVRANDTEGWVHAEYVTGGEAVSGDDPAAAATARVAALEAELAAARAAAAAEIRELRAALAAATRERDALAADLARLRAASEPAAAGPEPASAGESLVRVAEPLRPGADPAAPSQRAAIVAAVQRWARDSAGADVTDVEVTLLAADRARVHCTLVVGSGRRGTTAARVLEARLADGAWTVEPSSG